MGKVDTFVKRMRGRMTEVKTVSCKDEIARLKVALDNQITAAEWEADQLRAENHRLEAALRAARAELVEAKRDLAAGTDGESRWPPRAGTDVRIDVDCSCCPSTVSE